MDYKNYMAGDLEGFEKKIKSGFDITLDELPVEMLHLGKDAIICFLVSFIPEQRKDSMEKAAYEWWDEHKIKMIK
jgi:hypothetical protein